MNRSLKSMLVRGKAVPCPPTCDAWAREVCPDFVCWRVSNYALRVPESLLAYARLVAQEEKVSMNQFFVTACVRA